MELAAYYAAHHRIGDPDGRAMQHTDALYLLDDTLCVIGAVTPTGKAPLGKGFFSLFPAQPYEVEALKASFSEFEGRNLLFLCEDTPALAIGSLPLHVGLLPVILPGEGVQGPLRAPALFDRVPESLRVSRCGLARYALPTDEERDAVARWYTSATRPFSYGAIAPDGEAALQAMSFRASHLAMLCGCRLEFDLTGLGMRPGDVFDIELYTGTLLAALMATHRVGVQRTLRMFTRREYGIGPVMYLELHRESVDDPLPELQPLARAAAARGAVFDCIFFENEPERVEIRASIAPVELSLQGVKEQHPLAAGRSVFDLIPGEIRFEQE